QPVGEHGFAHPGLAKQQHSPAIPSPSARQRGGKLGLLTVTADDRHVGGHMHAHTQPHPLLTAWVWQSPTPPPSGFGGGAETPLPPSRPSNPRRPSSPPHP